MPINTIPKHKDWLEKTAVFARARSDLMKKVDAAILKYEKVPTEQVKAEVTEALKAWTRSKTNWVNNERNSKGMISDLVDHLRGKSVVDPAAMKMVRDAAKEALYNVFYPSGVPIQLQWKATATAEFAKITPGRTPIQKIKEQNQRFIDKLAPSTMNQSRFQNLRMNAFSPLKTVADTAFAANAVASQSKSKIAQEIEHYTVDYIGQLTGITAAAARPVAEEILRTIGLGSLISVAADCAPFAGALTSGAKALKAGFQYAYVSYRQSSIREASVVLAANDPVRAFAGLDQMVTNELSDIKIQGVKSATAAVAKAVAAAADMGVLSGPILGAAEAFAELCILIRSAAGDYKMKKETNDFLIAAKGNKAMFANEIFTKGPLLGCYYLMICNTSDLLNVLGDNFGSTSWQADVQTYAKKLDSIRDKAADVIEASRLSAKGLTAHRIALEKKSAWIRGAKAVASFGS